MFCSDQDMRSNALTIQVGEFCHWSHTVANKTKGLLYSRGQYPVSEII
jgi:hypothetical protein